MKLKPPMRLTANKVTGAVSHTVELDGLYTVSELESILELAKSAESKIPSALLGINMIN